ncbi:MAG TPA: Holliday junction branch migration protein RuvA [Flavobacteriaceae bacterium]|nr:Holliday junction branch migration protein RuvA [Flavobacteriaceae bacterium]
MIYHIIGKLVEKNPTHVVIESNGLGYLIHISLSTFSKIGIEENLKLYTYLSIKEDAHTLFGFFDKSEREVFQLLISVSGVGPSTARTMLSSMTAEEVQRAIMTEDVATIQKAKGIGGKTAQRVIIDLKDKIAKTCNIDEISLVSNNTVKEETLSALEVLGFSRKQTEKMIDKYLHENPNYTIESLLKTALKNL